MDMGTMGSFAALIWQEQGSMWRSVTAEADWICAVYRRKLSHP